MNRIYYEETYGEYYEAENEESLLNQIREGKVDGPETCVGSAVAEIVGKGNPNFQIMGAKIDALDDGEKTFYLWHLLRFFYKAKLRNDKEKYSGDPTSVDQINRLLNNVEELDTLLCYELF